VKAWLVLAVNLTDAHASSELPEMCILEVNETIIDGLDETVRRVSKLKNRWPALISVMFDYPQIKWIKYTDSIARWVEDHERIIPFAKISPFMLKECNDKLGLDGFRIQVWPDGDLSFMCDHEEAGTLDTELIHIEKIERLFAECEE